MACEIHAIEPASMDIGGGQDQDLYGQCCMCEKTILLNVYDHDSGVYVPPYDCGNGVYKACPSAKMDRYKVMSLVIGSRCNKN